MRNFLLKKKLLLFKYLLAQNKIVFKHLLFLLFILKDINIIQKNITNFNNSKNYEIKFEPEEEGINRLLNEIKSFGKIKNINYSQLLNNSLIITKKEEEDLINSWISPNKKTFYELYFWRIHFYKY